MATLKKTFKADLCPKKPDPKLLVLGDTTVTVNVTLTAKQDVPSSKFDRCVSAAEAKIAEYQKIIQGEVNTLEGKIKAAQQKGDVKAMEAMADSTSQSVLKAGRSLQGAVETAVEATLKKEAQGDQNLLEARIAVGVNLTFKGISIASNVARIGVSHGADILAWKGLIMDIVDVVGIIQDLCKGENTLRQELLLAIGKYCTDKQRRVIEEQKAAASKKAKFTLVTKDVYRWFKPEADKAEAARKKYRNKVTDIRHDVDNFFGKVDKLAAAVKKAPTLKQGVAIGAKLMVMKRAGKGMVDALAKAQTFADDMAMLLTEAGVKVDDNTFVQRIKSLAALPDLLSFANELRGAAENVQSLVGSISQMAA